MDYDFTLTQTDVVPAPIPGGGVTSWLLAALALGGFGVWNVKRNSQRSQAD